MAIAARADRVIADRDGRVYTSPVPGLEREQYVRYGTDDQFYPSNSSGS